jgi:hypothetical protein
MESAPVRLLEKDLNLLVYELFGLTQEEIEMIEIN